jgi:hypothetical protein
MPLFWKRFLQGAIPFGLCVALLYLGTGGWLNALFLGLLGGVLFGLALAAFVTQAVKRSATPAFATHEQVLKDGPANHFRGLAAGGGWLFLTDSRLVFKTHPVNLRRYEFSMLLADIAAAQSAFTLWVIPNGLCVVTQSESNEHFVVDQRDEWSKAINALLPRST